MPRITISEPGKTPQPYRLKTDRELTKIGRGSDNDIVLETGSASTYHCMMKRVDGGFILEDNDSTNGILLDDTRFEIIDLEDDLTVFIGDDIELHFSLSEEEIETLEEEDFKPHQRAAFPKKKEEEAKQSKPKPEPVVLDDDEEEEEYEEVVVRRKKKKSVVIEEDDEDDNDETSVAQRERKKKKAVALDLDEDEEEKPRKKGKPAANSGSSSPRPRAAAAPVATAKAGGGAGTTIIFAILAVLFLLAGMCIRHAVDNDGAFLFSKQEQGK